ncbi:hypothetical protein L6164_035455 [Bauhinia variegata]|uniref:Uncharacterized protein n=1 Tax=Bauhinia variegata TaxID=167791 RepID=A0ACB9KE68_BAUVA|nr:hypothetical protein L6164_035455 [Bauhinia variegata]
MVLFEILFSQNPSESSSSAVMMVRSTSQKKIMLLFLCGAIFELSSSRSSCNEIDGEVLLQFKEGVVDPSKMLSSWSREEDCCKWIGVQCHNITGRVNELNLRYSYIDTSHSSERLRGEINLISLLQLEFLNYLDLSDNDFTSISDKNKYHSHRSTNSSTLLHLDLAYNYNLQMDNLHWLSHVPSLTYLDLSGIILQKETDWLQSLTPLSSSLSELHLSMCALTSLGPFLGFVNFTSLSVLDFSSNYFHSQIPYWLSNLSDSFFNLDLRMNGFYGQLPDTLLNLQSLKYLLLGLNKMTGTIPKWLGQYKHLEELDLSGNSFYGSVPLTLGNISSLTHLDVRANHLNGTLPESLGQLSNLQTLLLGANAFAGVISESNFDKLTNLKWLDLRASNFLFQIGNDWTPPFQLDEIFLDFCRLGPKLPAWIYTQRSLIFFHIPSTGITTIDHHKFWSLVSSVSKSVDISNNSISGNMPNLVLNAATIDLSFNNITGGLPRLTSNVIYFYAGSNLFSGHIFPFLCTTQTAEGNNLFALDLSYNHLSGELPECWINWKNLRYLHLGDNNFTGKIPYSMGSLSEILMLYLGNNNFFGDIPLSLKNCTSLVFLNLERNKLSGSIPYWVGGQRTQDMQLRSNEFSGSIPLEICQLHSLIILDLADNRLSGPIPKCLENITAMSDANFVPTLLTMGEYDLGYRFRLLVKGRESEYVKNLKYIRLVDLSDNKFSGTIPRELFSLSLVQSLNLSNNHLIGKIPQEIGKMRNLESLDFSRNQLCGDIPPTMSDLTFLSVLNLSFNKFIGKIPTGTQLQSFDALSYMGNRELCGAPLRNCTQQNESHDTKLNTKDEDEDKFLSSFYIGMGVGFGVGFWGVCVVIFFHKTSRHAYFRFLDYIKDQCYLKVLLTTRSLR